MLQLHQETVQHEQVGYNDPAGVAIVTMGKATLERNKRYRSAHMFIFQIESLVGVF
jgi:hypothetical protein